MQANAAATPMALSGLTQTPALEDVPTGLYQKSESGPKSV